MRPIVALLVFAVVVPESRACSCAPQPTWADAVERADAVYLGRVAGYRPYAPGGPHPRFYTGLTEVAFDVERWWKGPVDSTATVLTEDQGSACGMMAERYETWIVVVFEHEGRLYATGCSSMNLADAWGSPLDSLGPGHPPTPLLAGGPGDDGVGPVGLGLVAVALLVPVVVAGLQVFRAS